MQMIFTLFPCTIIVSCTPFTCIAACIILWRIYYSLGSKHKSISSYQYALHNNAMPSTCIIIIIMNWSSLPESLLRPWVLWRNRATGVLFNGWFVPGKNMRIEANILVIVWSHAWNLIITGCLDLIKIFIVLFSLMHIM